MGMASSTVTSSLDENLKDFCVHDCMLAAYFDIKAPTCPSKKGKMFKSKSKHVKPTTQAPTEHVEPFDMHEGGAVHAQFKPPPQAPEPLGMCGSTMHEAEPIDARDDPFEYLWQEANTAGQVEEDDTDSCLTFEDDASETTENLAASPVDATFDALDKTFFCKRKAKASEVPIYSGPELWYEDDDFVE